MVSKGEIYTNVNDKLSPQKLQAHAGSLSSWIFAWIKVENHLTLSKMVGPPGYDGLAFDPGQRSCYPTEGSYSSAQESFQYAQGSYRHVQWTKDAVWVGKCWVLDEISVKYVMRCG